MALRCCPYLGKLVHIKRGGSKKDTSDEELNEVPRIKALNHFYNVEQVSNGVGSKQTERLCNSYESNLSIEEIMRQAELDLSWDNFSSSGDIPHLWSPRPTNTATQTTRSDVHSIAFYANQPLWLEHRPFQRCLSSSTTSELGLTDLEFNDQICEIDDDDDDAIPFDFNYELACCPRFEHRLFENDRLKRYEEEEENFCHSSLERALEMCACGGSDELLDTSTDTATTDSGSKFEDSGIGRTDDSTKNDESSEQESPEVYKPSLGASECVWSGRDTDTTSVFTFDDLHNFTVCQPMSSTAGLVRRCSESSSIECEIAALNDEMDRIRNQCHELMELHNVEQCDVEKSENSPVARVVPRMGTRLDHVVPRMGTRVDHIKQWQSFRQQLPIQRIDHELPPTSIRQEPVWFKRNEIIACLPVTSPLCRTAKVVKTPVEVHEDTTTSAYNTGGDSCCSTPVLSAEPLKFDNSNFERHKTCEKDNQNNVEGESLKALYNRYVDVMYTNSANLQHTIMVQQKLFQQQINATAHSTHENTSATMNSRTKDTPSEQVHVSGDQCSSTGLASNLEWVVKRRSDGSRYITRRPIRKQILKERARKLAEERCGVTTDDDAASEYKTGRYWSREERKQQLEKARNDREQKKMVLRQRMETLAEAEDQPNIVALSHQKMMRHKGRKVFDDFTTLQEILAHGSRELQGKSYNPLLSVTTV